MLVFVGEAAFVHTVDVSGVAVGVLLCKGFRLRCRCMSCSLRMMSLWDLCISRSFHLKPCSLDSAVECSEL
ncbi:hypothetical protein BO94DRAFT_320689 [Aspergillus sclerotioniger CBS 115572]|uniref:Uncharacterized protein n=1 Tax=Aspergillus sclerotioniger CBS 115572 TaxID=1450535 RepID=A0A317X710_9EURO|nr:hypothetical protein BO94DRAFT_320689 [Aspergillus sclerotioniger CBS 115572]PWY94125.1 hypothetical protein BO94DRAFT_320689 [Aspergillus sclerotioniger CBS 115572]